MVFLNRFRSFYNNIYPKTHFLFSCLLKLTFHSSWTCSSCDNDCFSLKSNPQHKADTIQSITSVRAMVFQFSVVRYKVTKCVWSSISLRYHQREGTTSASVKVLLPCCTARYHKIFFWNNLQLQPDNESIWWFQRDVGTSFNLFVTCSLSIQGHLHKVSL